MPQTNADQPVVLHETDAWMVINKPGGWHSVRAGLKAQAERSAAVADAAAAPVLEEWLARQRPELQALPECGLVHRLDQHTSGCVLIARSIEALENLRAMAQGRRTGLRKVYLALAAGRLEDDSFDLYFRSRHRRSQKIMVLSEGEESQRGRCRWRRLEVRGDHTLLEVEILGAGRRHQIRAGLAHLGHPLRGDVLYGGAEWVDGFGLHAVRLSVLDATITAPPPRCWSSP